MKISINRNILWSDTAVEQLADLGLEHACISPGSRNTPLILAFHSCKKIKTHVIIDERTSGFFALGLAKRTGTPVAIVTTSGTAVAELYPAIIEAYQDRIPLIVCTADRPPEQRNTGANQTINQENIYRNHIRKFVDVGLPQIGISQLKRMQINIAEAWQVSSAKNIGPVHLNFPFEKPFEPESVTDKIDIKNLDRLLKHSSKVFPGFQTNKPEPPKSLLQKIVKSNSGIIFCGPGFYTPGFIKKCVRISKMIQFPILADGASNFRFSKFSDSKIISNATSFLRSKDSCQIADPELVIHFGKAPTSQSVLTFFEETKAEKYQINEHGDLHDPSKRKAKILKVRDEDFCDWVIQNFDTPKRNKSRDKFNLNLLEIETLTRKVKSQVIDRAAFPAEGRIVTELVNSLPQKVNLIVSNSTPIRDFDSFAAPSNKIADIFTNRGASGIDGLISTSLGITAASKLPKILLTGDLAFLHDIGGLAIAQNFSLPLVIVLINNNGGGIFEMLPISKNKNVFRKYFKTPQKVNFESVVKSFGGKFFIIKSWKDFRAMLKTSIKLKKLTVLEIKTDSSKSSRIKKHFWTKVEHEIKSYLGKNAD